MTFLITVPCNEEVNKKRGRWGPNTGERWRNALVNSGAADLDSGQSKMDEELEGSWRDVTKGTMDLRDSLTYLTIRRRV